jgi:outer membrane lipoprotein carrier protein
VAIIEKIRSSIDRIKPFKVSFVQQVLGEGDQVDLEESGEIIFKDHRLLKWTYLEPDLKVFLLKNDEYRFYDEDNEQLFIGKVGDGNSQWIWRLLFSDDIFNYAYSKGKENQYEIIIKNDEESLDIEITVDKEFLPVELNQLDPSGARVKFFFKKYRSKIGLPADAFQLTIPEGVEVIDETEGGNGKENEN